MKEVLIYLSNILLLGAFCGLGLALKYHAERQPRSKKAFLLLSNTATLFAFGYGVFALVCCLTDVTRANILYFLISILSMIVTGCYGYARYYRKWKFSSVNWKDVFEEIFYPIGR